MYIEEKHIQETTAVILVGGRSRRMNYIDKMNLKIGNDSFLEHIIKELSFFSRIIISANEQQMKIIDIELLRTKTKSEVYIIEDKFRDIGPLGGIYSVMSEGMSEYYFVMSCDMPLVRKEIIEELFIGLEEDSDITVGVTNERVQPLFSIYNKKVQGKIRNQINESDYKIMNLIRNVKAKYVQINEGESLTNFNTPEDLEGLKK